MIILIEHFNPILLLTQNRQPFRLPLDIFDMPLRLEMLPMFMGSAEDRVIATSRAPDGLLLFLLGVDVEFIGHFLGEVLSLVSLVLFLLLGEGLFDLVLELVQELQGAGLLRLQILVFGVGDHVDQHLDGGVVLLLAQLGQLSVLVRLDVVHFGEHCAFLVG